MRVFLIKIYNQVFMTRKQKHRVPDTYYVNNDYKSLRRLAGKFKTSKKHKKRRKTKKNSFPKEQIENTELHKPVLNKIMTTQE